MTKTIAVIEDNQDIRENLCEILELANYHVISAPNGKAGVELVISNGPDLILCDVMMPELDGFGVLRILNKRSGVNNIPFMFLTAKADKSDIRKGMGLGADDYITKPFDDAELLEAIEIRLKKAERLQSLTSSEEALPHLFSEARALQEFEALSKNNEVRTYKAKDEIYSDGQHPRWLYYIRSGQVKTYQFSEHGKELVTHVLHAGDFLGHTAMIGESPYTHSAAALQESTLQLVSRDDLDQLLFTSRDFAALFLKMIANRAKETEQQLLDLAYSSVRKKVANSLQSFAPPEIEGSSILLRVTRDDLASRAGTAKETLIRTLSDFKDEGLISIDGREIQIHDLARLRDIIS